MSTKPGRSWYHTHHHHHHHQHPHLIVVGYPLPPPPPVFRPIPKSSNYDLPPPVSYPTSPPPPPPPPASSWTPDEKGESWYRTKPCIPTSGKESRPASDGISIFGRFCQWMHGRTDREECA